MVIVSLHGGLGNQLFQYAFARSLAIRRNQELLLVVDKIDSTQKRRYALDAFNISGEAVAWEDIKRYGSIWGLLEIDFGYFPEYISESLLHRNILIHGYWQSERYFRDIASTIRADLSVRKEYLDPLPEDIIALMNKEDSVAVHVRRTDYLQEGGQQGFVGLSYYERAINHISSKCRDPHIFVFSDDIEWCKSSLHWREKTTFMERRANHAATDLYLMTLCKHFVIANSTYSWWSAWLAINSEKIVIAPQIWFNEERASETSTLRSENLVPEDWIRL